MELISSNLIIDLGLLLVLAAILAYIANKLKQPMILAYILAGLFLGFVFPNSMSSFEDISLLAQLGIAFLLFLVGMELNFEDVKHMAKASLIVGLGQVLFTFAIGYGIVQFLGYGVIESLYISIALTFSSTIVVLKILGEKNDVNSLYGKISIGILLVQDFVALAILVGLAGLGDGSSVNLGNIAFSLLKGVLFIVGALVLSRYVLSKIVASMAKSMELLFLGSIAICFLSIIVAKTLGLGIEIGSFIAGLSLANLPYRLEIGNKIKALRDFFIVLFFIMLGVQIAFTFGKISLMHAMVLSLFVIIGNPIIVLVIMAVLGYKKRTCFFTGLTVAQISEFSLILVALGGTLGHLKSEIVSLVSVIGVITITLSVYMMQYNEWLYVKLNKYLDRFERKDLKSTVERSLSTATMVKGSYVIFGCKRLGYNIALMLKELKKRVLIVDFNPSVIRKLSKEGFKCIYGDLGDYELFEEINLKDAEFVISTVPDKNASLMLVKRVKMLNKRVKTIVSVDHVDDALELYNAGADYVIVPNILSSEKVADILRIAMRDHGMMDEVKKRHIESLKRLGWFGE